LSEATPDAAEALILDFGGVISRTLFETHSVTEQALGLPAGSLTWKGPFDPDGDPLWQAMQAGSISEREYWQRRAREVGRLLGEEWDRVETFVRRARGARPEHAIRPEARRTIRASRKAGKTVAILSNELDLFYGPEFRGQIDELASLDAIVDGTYTGILKPDPRAYRLVLDAIGLEPRDCVFVDDQRRNVDGARAVGMRTVHFDVRHPETSFALALAQLGLEPS
jgi:putative hydrolase of the HAD superfamily